MAVFHPHWAAASYCRARGDEPGLVVLAVLALDLADDRRGVSPRTRLAAELAIAAFTVFFEPGAHRFCRELAQDLGPASFGLTAIGIVAVMNAMNLIDGLDGLAASSFVAIAGAISLLTGAGSGHPDFAGVSTLMLIPGLVVFLRRNWSPARAFLGDHGSLLLRLLPGDLRALSVQIEPRVPAPSVLDLVPLAIIFSYPMLDMILCMANRLRSRRPLFAGDRSHMHHRMLGLGLSAGESTVSLVSWQLTMLATSGTHGFFARARGAVAASSLVGRRV